MKYSGWSGEISLISAWSLAKYRQIGNRGMGLGMAYSFAYQPLKKISITLHGDIGYLYTDVHNQKAIIQVYPLDGNLSPIEFPCQLNVKNALFMGNIGIRYWIPTRYFQPFVMAGIGFFNYNTLFRLYDNNTWVLLGTSDKGLLLESSVSHKLYGSRFAATGVSWNAAYLLNLDLRLTLIQSAKFNYKSLKLPEEIALSAIKNETDGTLSNFEVENSNLFHSKQPVPFNMLMLSLSLTGFFE